MRTPNDIFEDKAHAFWAVTGFIAPGKDVPPELAYSEERERERNKLWRIFSGGWKAGRQDLIDYINTGAK